MNHSAIRIWTLLAASAALASCSNSERLDSQLEAEVKAYFLDDAETSHLTVSSAWHAKALKTASVCGFVETSGNGGKLRFYYEPHGKYGQVEMASGVAGDSDATDSLIVENRKLFNDHWDRSCAPFAPSIF